MSAALFGSFPSLPVQHYEPNLTIRVRRSSEDAPSSPQPTSRRKIDGAAIRHVDLAGRRVDRLVVRCRDEKRLGSFWICDCDCGDVVSRRSDELQRPGGHSCGPSCSRRHEQ